MLMILVITRRKYYSFTNSFKVKKSAEPGFWDNRDKAEKTLKEISSNKLWTDAYDEVLSSIYDLETLHEFYQSGEVDEDELADEYSKSL